MMLRRLLALAPLVVFAAAPRAARAEGPPAQPAPYAPPRAYASSPAYPSPYPPPEAFGAYTPMKVKSSGMIAAGSVLVSVATTAIIAGAALFSGGNQTEFVSCPFPGPCNPQQGDSGAKAGGIGLMVVGLAAMAAGIPLIVVGAQRVPDRDEPTATLPTLRIGAGAASLRWSF